MGMGSFLCHVCGWALMFGCKGMPIELICPGCHRQAHATCFEDKLFGIHKPLVCKSCASGRAMHIAGVATQQIAIEN